MPIFPLAWTPEFPENWLGSPPRETYRPSLPAPTAYADRHDLTIDPFESKAPDAQNEFVTTSRGVTELVFRFHRAPHAEWLLICRGSSDARSNHSTSVGETTMASNATIPEVLALTSKLH